MSDGIFHKYHALGNDYIVLDPETWPVELTPARIIAICERNRGLGSDGILYGPLSTDETGNAAASHSLRIYNPDGSEAEKSGNGIRIFARYLLDSGKTTGETAVIKTKSGAVTACYMDKAGNDIEVAMGGVTFRSRDIPANGPDREIVDEPLVLHTENGVEEVRITALSVGNPHCVVFCDNPDRTLAERLGPLIETNPVFPGRTNVQFVTIVDRDEIRMEIWERGAGYTLASGSSSCAAAAASKKRGFCDERIRVRMPGGTITVGVADWDHISMRGSVTPVARGRFENSFMEFLLSL